MPPLPLLLLYSKQMADHGTRGVYLLPSPDDVSIWHGLLFLPSGAFKDAVIRFTITIPAPPPSPSPSPSPSASASPRPLIPSVHIQSDVFHPLVTPVGGAFDLSLMEAYFDEKRAQASASTSTPGTPSTPGAGSPASSGLSSAAIRRPHRYPVHRVVRFVRAAFDESELERILKMGGYVGSEGSIGGALDASDAQKPGDTRWSNIDAVKMFMSDRPLFLVLARKQALASSSDQILFDEPFAPTLTPTGGRSRSASVAAAGGASSHEVGGAAATDAGTTHQQSEALLPEQSSIPQPAFRLQRLDHTIFDKAIQRLISSYDPGAVEDARWNVLSGVIWDVVSARVRA
ncbi:hypothetical protein M427DRAFT_284532 [Gonapodya prolifera JEL478]|uniref:Uncharacterized protein n=1 Tax=Gonapodya prolifera (strain JEL478) TaxID=1344416 RepID=A0A139AJ10_GONPJ|nr:hypothetical protein M427DRAFT_284532 [Gonapodya prolifera JEL478]|eukprot:KXS16786.1 hypothetical protein M427DRAFT_284532 [Gonapodya prolifera JEL478]